MSITIIARNLTIKQATRKFINEKFEKFSKYLRNNNPLRIALSKEKNAYQVVLNVPLNNRHGHLTITERAESIHEVLNIVSDRTKVQLNKNKEKLF